MTKVKSTEIIKSFEKGPVRRSLFSNGAVTLFHQFKGMESACANLYILAGSIFEKPSEHGIAHVIEHMLFKEEKTNSVVRDMEKEGAQINAYTYKEYVCFELECAAVKLEQFLPKFLSLFLNPVFTKKDLALEKKVILQELREDKDDHETEGLEYIYKKNFKAPLAHSIGGNIKNVKSFTPDDLSKFYKKYYTPNRMVLSVVSGRKFSKLESIFCSQFKETTSRKPFRIKNKLRFSALEHVNSKLKRKMESSIVYYSFNGASIFHKDYYTYMVLDEYLFGGMSSKLFVELREKSGLVYGLGSALNSYAGQGNYIMIFNTHKSNIRKLQARVESVLTEFIDKGLDEAEVKSIRDRVALGWKLGFDDMLERNEYLAELEMLNMKDYSLSTQTKRLDEVDSKSMQALVEKVFNSKYTKLVMSS